jgi:hypothetical protein
MTGWHVLLGGLGVLGVAAALYGLDRLGLWLEDRGWLYYRRKKPGSSPVSMFVALQQFIEPGVKHVREVGQERHAEDEEARKERLLAGLIACLQAAAIDPGDVRRQLAAIRQAGWDYEQFYAEAVRVLAATRPERAALIPPLHEVAPTADGESPAV